MLSKISKFTVLTYSKYHKYKMLAVYITVKLLAYTIQRKILTGGNFDIFDAFQLEHQILTRQIV